MSNPFLRHPNRKAKKPKGHPERELQIECVEWFRKKYRNSLIVQVPNEACFNRAKEFKKMGMLKGASDVYVVHRGQVLFVEFKADDGVQSREQRAFQHKVEALGFRYYIIKSLQDFKDVIV